MNKFAITGGHKPPKAGFIAISFVSIIGGVLLSSVAAVLPAHSADLYPYAYPYPDQYTTYTPSYYQGCNSCGCNSCGCRPCCNPCGVRTYVRPAPVVERHWDYWERRYPSPYPYRYPGYYPSYAGYPYNPYSAGYPYSSYPDDYPAYGGGPRPHLGFGGVQYPPAPISYEYQTPRPPYEYQAAAPAAYDYQSGRPGYDYELPPRPPVGIPGGFSNASYIE